jgi:phage terminase small subunit
MFNAFEHDFTIHLDAAKKKLKSLGKAEKRE